MKVARAILEKQAKAAEAAELKRAAEADAKDVLALVEEDKPLPEKVWKKSVVKVKKPAKKLKKPFKKKPAKKKK